MMHWVHNPKLQYDTRKLRFLHTLQFSYERQASNDITISNVPKADAQLSKVCPTSSIKFTSNPPKILKTASPVVSYVYTIVVWRKLISLSSSVAGGISHVLIGKVGQTSVVGLYL